MKWISGNSSSRTVFTVEKLPLWASSFNPLEYLPASHMHKLIPQGDLMFAVERLTFKCCIHRVPQGLDNVSNSSWLTYARQKSSCTEAGLSPVCCFPCDERWWLQQQLLDSSVVCMCASARKSIFLLEVLFLPKQPFFVISRENVWAGLKLLPASFSCIVLFNRTCPVKSASIVILQDLYYMYYTLSSLESIPWRNLLFQFRLQN